MQIVAAGVDPKQQTFFFWCVLSILSIFAVAVYVLLKLSFEINMVQLCKHSSKSGRRRKRKSPVQNPKHVHPLALDPDLPGSIIELREKTDGKF